MFNKIKKMERIIKRSQKVGSFYSSFLASIYVAVSFLFVTYFAPYGQSKWYLSWSILPIFILLYCLVYHPIGKYLIKKAYPKEIEGYKNNFLASLLTSIYITISVLSGFNKIVLIITSIIFLIIFYLICYKIAHKRYERREKSY